MSIPIEIERKYVIYMPDISVLAEQDNYTVSKIRQTYLESESGITHRIRMRVWHDRTVYTETKKIRIDKMSAYEQEREIDEEEYHILLGCIKHGTRTLSKVRHTFTVAGQLFEVDVYPEWVKSCILETELRGREETVSVPEFIRVISEVTGDRRYSNASMSYEFTDEII